MWLFDLFRTMDRTKFENNILNKISLALFPPLEKHIKGEHEFIVDTSAASNLEAALTDIEDGQDDITTMTSIKDVIKTLEEIRTLLGVNQEIVNTSQYYIVDKRN